MNCSVGAGQGGDKNVMGFGKEKGDGVSELYVEKRFAKKTLKWSDQDALTAQLHGCGTRLDQST